MDGYMNLANAIVKQAADDYFQLLAEIMPIPIPPSCNLAEIERFFHSDWYDLLCKIDPGYLMRKLKEKAEKMKLEYVVTKEWGSNRYYVHRVGEPYKAVPGSYGAKKRALRLAAKLQGLEYKAYMQLRRRDGADND